MAFLNEENKLQVEIPSTTVITGFTVYDIKVSVGSVDWLVGHRYKDFQLLHQQLTDNHGIAKHLLPPKKIIGNKDPVFVERRRLDLLAYLQGVVALMQQAIVDELAAFLSLASYEVLYLRQRLAAEHCCSTRDTVADYTPLQLHAISHGLAHPAPSHTASAATHDFCHIAEAGTTIRSVAVRGSWHPWRKSNIIPNELEYNFNIFKKIQTLSLYKCNVLKITDASNLRKSVCKLTAQHCGLANVSDIVLCDAVHRDVTEEDNDIIKSLPKWAHVKDLDLRNNHISSIDLSISLCTRLETINLSGNKLSGLDYLTKLPYLISVVVSNNAIVELPGLRTKLGNLVHLDLSRNKMVSLVGLACLYSLVSLDVSCNLVAKVTEVEHVARLPCLEELILTGNPVSTVVDYRTKVLECFGGRCSEVCLDNERPTQRELDKVAVLQALRAARENKGLPTLNIAPPLHMNHGRYSTASTPDLAFAVEEATKLE